MAQRSWKSADFIEVKNNWQRYILTIKIFNKTTISCEESIKNFRKNKSFILRRASLLDLKLVQAFARVSLARDPITSFIFLIRSLDLLRDFALTLNSETPHTKSQKACSQVSWKARPPPPTPPYGLLEPVLHLFHGMSGAKSADYHGSWSFLSIYLCWNVSFCFYLCFGTQLGRFGAK